MVYCDTCSELLIEMVLGWSYDVFVFDLFAESSELSIAGGLLLMGKARLAAVSRSTYVRPERQSH